MLRPELNGLHFAITILLVLLFTPCPPVYNWRQLKPYNFNLTAENLPVGGQRSCKVIFTNQLL